MSDETINVIVGVSIGFGIPMLATTPVAALLCRRWTANDRLASYTKLFAPPIFVAFAFIICMSFRDEGFHIFTYDYWTDGKGGFLFWVIVYLLIVAVCCLPSLGVMIYYEYWRKRKLASCDAHKS